MAKDFFRSFMRACVLGLAVVLVVAIGAAHWLGVFSSPTVTVRNESPAAVTGVVISGTGFSEPAGTINAGGEKTVSVHPNGKSGIRITFTAGQNHFDSGEQEYIAGSGDRFTATIGRDFRVNVRR